MGKDMTIDRRRKTGRRNWHPALHEHLGDPIASQKSGFAALIRPCHQGQDIIPHCKIIPHRNCLEVYRHGELKQILKPGIPGSFRTRLRHCQRYADLFHPLHKLYDANIKSRFLDKMLKKGNHLS